MTDEKFVFNLAEFMEEAAKEGSNRAYGNFQQVIVEPGVWGYIKGRDYHDQFFSAVTYKGMDRAELEAKKAGSSGGRHCFKLVQLANTSITERQNEYERTTYVFPGTWLWKLWEEHTVGGENALANDMFGVPVFAHVAAARHPEFDENDKATFTRDTVWWDKENNEPKVDDEGKVRPQYYEYLRAAFRTESELRDYAIANGVEVEAGTPSFKFDIPAGWQLDAEVWDETVSDLVNEIKANRSPRPVVLKSLAPWLNTGMTQAELEHIYDTVMTASGAGEPPF